MHPVIDMHVHVFNALDIPMEGYLRSRRIERKRPCDLEYIINFFPGPQVFNYLVDRMRDRCVTRQLGGGSRGWFYSMLLKMFGSYMGQDLESWEIPLTQTHAVNARSLADTWKEVDLFVPLLIDFEYWFRNTVDNPLEVQADQMVENVIKPWQGRYHPFVPFDPARELVFRKGLNNPDGQKETLGSLALVRRCIEQNGYIGVKIYNTIGYRPLNNARGLTPLHRQRMALRNDKIPYLFRGEEYDEVLCELYSYCEKQQVPITAHCMINGLEAYPGASADFGHACYWRDVLDRFPGLVLNLAHFGWNPVSGNGYGKKQNWMKTICGMITEYDHLYADVSHHEVVRFPVRNDFIAAYRNIRKDFGKHLDKLRKRILYGSDWQVLCRVRNYRSFMKAYVNVMEKTGFYDKETMHDFLGGNAMTFLGLVPGGKNRERLTAFYRRNKLEPPKWFRESESTGGQ
ncbi:amidohydrolase family protein [bacterium]|nr:amidohydrolase family protein [bacterium]